MSPGKIYSKKTKTLKASAVATNNLLCMVSQKNPIRHIYKFPCFSQTVDLKKGLYGMVHELERLFYFYTQG